jgi:hypothetical protein
MSLVDALARSSVVDDSQCRHDPIALYLPGQPVDSVQKKTIAQVLSASGVIHIRCFAGALMFNYTLTVCALKEI